MTNIGLILYINEIINKDTILTTTDFKFKSVDTFSDKSILNDTLDIFNLYMSNIEEELLDYTFNFTDNKVQVKKHKKKIDDQYESIDV